MMLQITASQYKIDLSEENLWIKNTELYTRLKTKDTSFEVILIGLDGAKK